MAAVLELLLREEVAPGAVVRWLDHGPSHRPAELVPHSLLQKDFVPFLLNFLREQTSQILTNGPSTPKANLGSFLMPTPDVQPVRRGRRKGYNSANAAGRQVARDIGRSLTEEEDGKGDSTSLSGGRRKRSEVGPTSPNSPPDQLNLNNLEEFPPMSAASGLTNKSKPSRRINPTPVSAERSHSKPKMCFTSTPVSQSPAARFPSGTSLETFAAIQEGNVTSITGSSLQEEREMLKKERCKLLHQTSPAGLSLDPSTPTKPNYSWSGSLATDSQLVTCADLTKVSCKKQLEQLAQLYSTCIAENLVPNIFLELFFVLQLLTSKGTTSSEDGENDLEFNQGCKDAVERQHFRNVHNCVYFAVQVLDCQFEIISRLEKGTLKLLAENERIASFSPGLHAKLMKAYESSTAKVSLLLPSSVQSVSFQPETDNRSNFPSDRAFHIFKKQRDIFYELLREWEDNHEKPGWDFERCGWSKISKIKENLINFPSPSFFPLLKMCKGPIGGGTSWGDTPDQDVLNMLGSDNLSRLKRLQERFVVPQSIRGPCPPPAFPGCQQFFRDFILSAGSYQFNQHLMDSLCLKILELDGLTLVEHEPSDGEADMDEQDEKKRFTAALMTLRLLAKFLGFLVFLPYQTVEPPSRDLQESAVALRNQTLPVLDVLKLLRRSILNRRTILTVPWVVEFLSLVDHFAPFLDYYGRVFSLLLQLYRCLVLSEDKEMSFLNKLLILAVLGWLFQVHEFLSARLALLPTVRTVYVGDYSSHLFFLFTGELRKLLASFVAGSGAKNGGFIRKITPTAAESLAPKPCVTQQKLQEELEQAFFHNQPPSLRRTVEFVAERVGSNCVKHIKATLVAELVKRAEVMLQDKVKEEDANHSKLLDEVCAQLYEEGAQALHKGRDAEDIAVGLATEKACTWLSTNITALIKREVRTTFNRMLRVQGPSLPSEDAQGERKGCPPNCQHHAPFPSQIINEIKDVLCIAVGPRDEDEGIPYVQLECLLKRLSQTLQCRKFMCPTSEQQLARCTVELASLLVSDRVPIQGLKPQTQKKPERQRGKKNAIYGLLKSLLLVWKEDFWTPVPVQLMFSRKNVGYIAEVERHEWDFFLFMLRGLVDHDLMGNAEIESCLHSLQELLWSSDFLEELETISRIFISEYHVAEPRTRPCELVRQPRGTVAAQS
uniref:Codanin-1 C-terminal domain-containing protein n=1 Tax=Chrysemys picta bellii TaxID=8478 RepID=A0A8C3P581_CHRPI